MDNKKTTRHFEITGLSPVLDKACVVGVRGCLIGLATTALILGLVLRAPKLLVKVF